MSTIDVDTLLAPISEDHPAGQADPDEDPAFTAMELAAEGKPERQMGDAVLPAEEPEWGEVQQLATEVLGRAKDLRAAMLLTRAVCRLEGWPGFASGLSVIAQLVEHYWEDLYPRLDGEEDPVRANVLAALVDREATLDVLRRCPLVESRMLGAFSLWHIDVARGNEAWDEDDDAEPPTEELIRAAYREAAPEDLRARLESVEASGQSLTLLEETLTSCGGRAAERDFEPLREVLSEAVSGLREALAEHGDVGGEAEESADVGSASGVASGTGAINTWEDVSRAIDRICEFYERAEPASPVPLLLRRAQAMVKMDFMEIINEIAPGGLSEAVQLLKSRAEQENSE